MSMRSFLCESRHGKWVGRAVFVARSSLVRQHSRMEVLELNVMNRILRFSTRHGAGVMGRRDKERSRQ